MVRFVCLLSIFIIGSGSSWRLKAGAKRDEAGAKRDERRKWNEAAANNSTALQPQQPITDLNRISGLIDDDTFIKAGKSDRKISEHNRHTNIPEKVEQESGEEKVLEAPSIVCRKKDKKKKGNCTNSTITANDRKRDKQKIMNEEILVMEKGSKCSSRTLHLNLRWKNFATIRGLEEKGDYHECRAPHSLHYPTLHPSRRSDPLTCFLKTELLCDGLSACADDECGCDQGDHGNTTRLYQDVFYCSDGLGCVAMDQVCDGQPDCLDQSDECVCENYLNCQTNRVFSRCKGGALRADKCGRAGGQEGGRAGGQLISTSDQAALGLLKCLNTFTDTGWAWKKSVLKQLSKSRKQAYKSACKTQCQPIQNHCEFIDWSNIEMDPETKTLSANYSCGDGSSIPLSGDMDVCDGYNDCPNRADETFCASRFYCSDGSKSLAPSKVCDAVPDCTDLSDECQSCARDNLADEKHMISNKYLNYYMVILCLLIVVLNCRGLYGHGVRLNYISRHNSRIDSALCLQLSVYDCLMGVYLLIITQKNFQYYGSYCLYDASWRSSAACNLSGFIFTLSSHGSLMTVVMMGAIRCYNCENMLAFFSLKRFLIGLTLGNILNLFCSSVALFPTEYLENVFVTTVFFQDNRLMKKGTKTLIDDLLKEYYGHNLTYEVPGWSNRLDLLSQITSNPELFLPTFKFGFFNQSPLCIQNLFSNDPDDDLQLLKMLYVSFLGAVILSFTVCYIWIVFIRIKSVVPTASPAFRRTTLRNNKKLSRKVSLIISSQLIAWIPIIIATILTLSNKKIPPDFYEMTAIVLVPVNSLFNPIFHSPRHVLKKTKRGASQATLVTQLGTMRSQSTGENRAAPLFQQSWRTDVKSGEVSNTLVGIDLK